MHQLQRLLLAAKKRAMTASAGAVEAKVEVNAKSIQECICDDDKEKPFLAHLADFWAFLLRKGPTQSEEIGKFIDLCLAGSFLPNVVINGKSVRGFKLVRKVIKLDVYLHAQLPVDLDADEDVKELLSGSVRLDATVETRDS